MTLSKFNDTFVETTEDEIEELLKGSKANNTNKSTETLLNRLRKYSQVCDLPDLKDIENSELPNILKNSTLMAEPRSLVNCIKPPVSCWIK